MRIIETVFPLKVPQQPRVFTLEVTEDELKTLVYDEFVPAEMMNQVEDAIASAL